MYIKRNIEELIKSLTHSYKVLLLTGPRGVGKSILLKHFETDTERIYVSLDDLIQK